MIDARTRQRIFAPYPHGMSGGAMFGVKVNDATSRERPNLKLIGIMTNWSQNKNEIFGPSMAIIVAIIQEVWSVPIPARLLAHGAHVM
jgi:hypothetical protein